MPGAISTLPHYVSVDGAFEAEHLSLPWGDIIGQGVITGGAPATPMLVTQNGSPNMTVLVAGGSCWITNDGISASDKYYRGGAWRCGRSDQVSLAIGAAHATLNRIDRVVAEVLDSQFAGASDLWRYRVIAGTASGSPSAPAEPDNAITLATVSIVAADTAITNAEITDLRPTASVGAKIAAATAPLMVPVDLINPRISTLAGNAFADVIALTDHDMGLWRFVKDVEGRIYGRVRVPETRAAATIVLAIAVNATSGVSRWQVGYQRVADGASLNPAALTDLTAQDITVPATAYNRKDVTFALGAVTAGEVVLLELKHDGAHANDTVAQDTLLVGAWLGGA